MKIIYNSDKQYKNPVVLIGVFDGVHLAHKKIILKGKREAEKIDGITLILTFTPHPLKITSSNTDFKVLTLDSEKLEILKSLGVDVVALIDFDKKFSELSPEDFVEKILVKKLKSRKIFVGSDFKFGKNRSGNVRFLKEKSKIYNFEVKEIKKISLEGKRISSSLIRKLIKDGKIKKANKFLGYNYFIRGRVIKGKKIGRILSFPTANLSISPDKLLPKDGVYAGYVYLPDNKKYLSAINIGFAPTFNKRQRNVEAYLLNFKGNLYGRNLKIELLERIRGEKKFKDEKQLIQQIKKDIEKIKNL